MLPGDIPFKGTRIDREALSRIARDVFGLSRPVELTRRPMRSYWGQAASWPWLHKITLDSGHETVEHALHTLTHELTHCVQAELAGHRAWLDDNHYQRAIPYDQRPIEIEANNWADEFWTELLPVVKLPT